MSRNQLIPSPICALFARRNDCVSERLTESWVSNSRQTLISGSEVVVQMKIDIATRQNRLLQCNYLANCHLRIAAKRKLSRWLSELAEEMVS